jgi:hypothetical protein
MTAIHKPQQRNDADEKRRLDAIQFLQTLRDAQGEERDDQLATWEYLENALNEYRTSDRKRI